MAGWSSIFNAAQREMSVLGLSSKMNMAACCPRAAAAAANWAASVDLPVPAAPTMSVLVPSSMPPPSKASIAGIPLASLPDAGLWRCSDATSRGKTIDAARLDDVIVVAPAELYSPVLHDAKPAPFRSVLGTHLLQAYDAMSDALHLQVLVGGGHVVEQEDRAFRRRKTA